MLSMVKLREERGEENVEDWDDEGEENVVGGVEKKYELE